jgi:hypothetical protein
MNYSKSEVQSYYAGVGEVFINRVNDAKKPNAWHFGGVSVILLNLGE